LSICRRSSSAALEPPSGPSFCRPLGLALMIRESSAGAAIGHSCAGPSNVAAVYHFPDRACRALSRYLLKVMDLRLKVWSNKKPFASHCLSDRYWPDPESRRKDQRQPSAVPLGVSGPAGGTRHTGTAITSGSETAVPITPSARLHRWSNGSSSFAALEKSLFCAIPPYHFKRAV
jgi:hypothetical protein